MQKSEYDEYDLNKKINSENIQIGIGLNKVDNLKPSKYFYQALNQSHSYEELEQKIIHYYKNQKEDTFSKREKECDLVSQRIAKLIEDEGFSLSPISLKAIHRKIFKGVFSQELENCVGVFRIVNIFKKEEIFNEKASVFYANYDEIDELLEYDFSKEKKKNYTLLNNDEKALSLAQFISNIWQIHPFREGNTRTIAVFTIKYLNSMGFSFNNDIFKEHSKYFRNALVLANYSDMKNNISENFSYLEDFFKKLLGNEKLEFKAMPKSVYYCLDEEEKNNQTTQETQNLVELNKKLDSSLQRQKARTTQQDKNVSSLQENKTQTLSEKHKKRHR